MGYALLGLSLLRVKAYPAPALWALIVGAVLVGLWPLLPGVVQHLSAVLAERCAHQQTLRIHGDFGYWNILWADDRPVVFDFDDMAMGIAAQDLALLMDSLDEPTVRLAERQGIDHSPFIAGYREIRSLDSQCAALLNPLLALRVVHINAWAASRIFDPAFQTKFADFRSVDYWSRSMARMRQCLSRVEV